jgi:trigger factor
MQVEVTSKGLERRLTVALPAEQYDKEIVNRLKSLSQRVRVDGFRAGKVPLKVVEQRWGGSVRQEVRDELANSSFYEAINKEKLRPAGMPHFEFQAEEPGAGLKYTAVFEVYPEIEIQMPAEFKIDKPSASIGDADIDKMVETLRKQRQTWETVSRGAQEGDRVVMDFTGTLDGKEFPGNSAKGYAVVVGSGALLGEFDANLIGLKAGDDKGFDIQFPKDYHAQDLAGKLVHFDVKIHDVAEGKLPDLNEEFFKSYGVKDGGVEAFRAEIKATMQREMDQAIKERVKVQVMAALMEANPIEVPKVLIDEEIKRIKEQGDNLDPSNRGAEASGEVLEERARQRVALGLIIAEIIKKNQFKADPEKVRSAVNALAASYESPDEVVAWYYARRERLGNVEALVLEDQAAEWLTTQAEVQDKPMSFDELVNSRRTSA